MIEKLGKSNNIDVYEFIKRVNDRYQDFYITIDKQRRFLNDWDLIDKILKTQELYGSFDKQLNGILMIYREKGFRNYVKILAENREVENRLIKFFFWNCAGQDLFLKLKKQNPLSKFMQHFGFVFSGDRGLEVLLFRKGTKQFKYYSTKDSEEQGE